MTLLSWAAARAMRLPPANPGEVAVERDLEVKMEDGAVLLADRWYSPSSVGSAPIVLMRSPYGRAPLGLFGRLFAERGYQTVIQSCRGTFGSGGTFSPFRYEEADGLATLDWLAGQPWFTGAIGTFGPSYLGLTQWAVAADGPEFLKAVALNVTASDFRDTIVYPGGTFSLETGATWVDLVEFQELPTWQRIRALATSAKRIGPAYTTLPLSEADVTTHGHRIEFYQDWLAHEQPGDPWWDAIDYSRRPGPVPPATLVGGWYDVFLPGQVRDFVRLRAAGSPAQLTIGPWTHASPRGAAAATRDALEWFDANLRSRPGGPRRDSVRIWVMGRGSWVDLPDWPPPAEPQRWHLHEGGRLAPADPETGEPDRYHYHPADPTPGVGGASLDVRNAGRRDQSRREIRGDVLCYTSDALVEDVTVAGPLVAEVWLESSHPHVDLFVRLCEVTPSGKSYNISDGILRLDSILTGAGEGVAGPRQVRVEMWPTAVTFRRGHRIRVQVSGGAHPLYARNTGSGERLASAATLVPSDVAIWHDPAHPSAIELPISSI